jgi:tripartite-type tricarboxylate transporter receptor subunit TctC
MYRVRRGVLLAVALLVTWTVATVPVLGQPARYPSRPITMLVGFAAGGATDLLARNLAEAARRHFDQPLVVVNRPGGAGTIATAELAKAAPDGYTILLQAIGPLAVQPHLRKLPYTVDDMIPVLHLGRNPSTLAVRADAPWRTVPEFIEAARRDPGKIRIAVPGMGTIHHLNLSLLNGWARISTTFMFTVGGPPSVAALLGGHVEAIGQHYNEYVAHVEAGRIRPLGVFSEERNPFLPAVPTFKEFGYNITGEVFNFIVIPRGTPEPVRRYLHDRFRRALAEPAMVEWARKNLYTIEYLDAEGTDRRVRYWNRIYADVVRHLGIAER